MKKADQIMNKVKTTSITHYIQVNDNLYCSCCLRQLGDESDCPECGMNIIQYVSTISVNEFQILLKDKQRDPEEYSSLGYE